MKIGRTKRDIVKTYASKRVYFDFKPGNEQLGGGKYRFDVKVLPETKVADIKKHYNDVRLHLKLDTLEIEEEPNGVHIIVSKKRSKDGNKLIGIINSFEYEDAYETMGLALPFGIDPSGNPVIMDIMDSRTPQAGVSGTTGSGKSTLLKCLLTTIASVYSPQRVNLIVGDYANDLTPFKNLPHLSHPLINDFDTFLGALQVLKDEMERRTKLEGTIEFGKLSIIVCVFDEFNSFMAEADDKTKIRLATTALSQLLRRGRHAKIHFILAAHNPTKANMHIDLSYMPAKMVFQVSTLTNSLTALGKGGAENLKGNGDMLFKAYGRIQHLQGAYISDDEVKVILKKVQIDYSRKALGWQLAHKSKFRPRGRYGFTITNEALEQKAIEIQNEQRYFLPTNNRRQTTESANDRIFAGVVAWTLNQEQISINLISESFGVGWRRAKGFMSRLQDLGIVGELDAKLPRKVILHSVEDLPQSVARLLQKPDSEDLPAENDQSPLMTIRVVN